MNELIVFCETLNAHDAKHAKRYQIDAFGRAWKRRDDGTWLKVDEDEEGGRGWICLQYVKDAVYRMEPITE